LSRSDNQHCYSATIKQSKSADHKILAKCNQGHDHLFATGRRFTLRLPLRSHPDCRATRVGPRRMNSGSDKPPSRVSSYSEQNYARRNGSSLKRSRSSYTVDAGVLTFFVTRWNSRSVRDASVVKRHNRQVWSLDGDVWLDRCEDGAHRTQRSAEQIGCKRRREVVVPISAENTGRVRFLPGIRP